MQYLPIWAVFAPVLTCLSFQLSDDLGLVWGPIVGGLLSCHSIIVPAIYAAATSYDGPNSKATSSGPLTHLLSGLPSLGIFMILEWGLPDIVSKFVTTWSFLNPFNAHLIIALHLALLLTQRRAIAVATVSIAAILALTSPYGNGPLSTTLLETALQSQEWTLVARQWSNTGYISVLENTQANYRVMRCDHSLLGGEWQLTPERKSQGWKVPESIYAAFHMLEAVRLVEVEPAIPDSSAQALVIGLGIGTAPKALISHGINTTIVELDPAVHSMATDYFSLPTNHTPILTDAIAWLSTQTNTTDPTPKKRYDYILHDVFTGGAEPLPLFTTTFLTSLRSLLTPNGVAAINYAGDLRLPLTAKILHTISAAFAHNCALYRDNPAKSEEDSFANFVVFCRNEPGEVRFRAPEARDFLGSIGRKRGLVPRAELAVEFPAVEKEGGVLEDAEVVGWRREQEESAGRHWGIMRVVLPGRVWGLY